MRRPIQSLTILTCFILTLGVTAGAAEGQMRRSAGTLNRGDSAERSAGPGSQSRGRSGSMSSSRRSSRNGPTLPSDRSYVQDVEEARNTESESDFPSRSNREDDEEFERDAAPTLGRACIYGPGDKVVYRPKGSRCRGDAPLQVNRPQETRRSSNVQSNARRNASPAAKASAYFDDDHYAAKSRRKKRAKRKTSSGCLYDPDGVVLFAPEKSDCINGIGAPPNATASRRPNAKNR